jgi:hypothetical protein
MKQNVTLALDKELLKKVKVLAAKKDTSITKLLTKQLVRIVSEEDHYESSKKRALTRLRKGYHLGGRILAQREELHECIESGKNSHREPPSRADSLREY